MVMLVQLLVSGSAQVRFPNAVLQPFRADSRSVGHLSFNLLPTASLGFIGSSAKGQQLARRHKPPRWTVAATVAQALLRDEANLGKLDEFKTMHESMSTLQDMEQSVTAKFY